MAYGTWQQYRRRRREAVEGGTGIMGVNCPHVKEVDYLCLPCFAEAWLSRNGLVFVGKTVESSRDVGNRIAGLKGGTEYEH